MLLRKKKNKRNNTPDIKTAYSDNEKQIIDQLLEPLNKPYNKNDDSSKPSKTQDFIDPFLDDSQVSPSPENPVIDKNIQSITQNNSSDKIDDNDIEKREEQLLSGELKSELDDFQELFSQFSDTDVQDDLGSNQQNKQTDLDITDGKEKDQLEDITDLDLDIDDGQEKDQLEDITDLDLDIDDGQEQAKLEDITDLDLDIDDGQEQAKLEDITDLDIDDGKEKDQLEDITDLDLDIDDGKEKDQLEDITDLDLDIDDGQEQAKLEDITDLDINDDNFTLENLDLEADINEETESPNLNELQSHLEDNDAFQKGLEDDVHTLHQEENFTGLTNEEIKLLRLTLKQYPYQLRMLVIKTLIEELCSYDEQKHLIQLITSESPSKTIVNYLERILESPIETLLEEFKITPKIIISNEKYGKKEVKEHLNKVQKVRRVVLFILFFIFFGIFFYQYAVRVWLYKSWIGDGVELITSNPLTQEKIDNAESIFLKAVTYNPNSPHAYIQYSYAYSSQGRYPLAFEKIFGKVIPIIINDKIQKSNKDPHAIWGEIKKIPKIKTIDKYNDLISINQKSFQILKKGAFLLEIENKKINGETFIALGDFHQNITRNFKKTPFFNPELSISYYKHLEYAELNNSFWKRNAQILTATNRQGDVYHHQKQYPKAIQTFENVLAQDIKNINANSGLLKSFIKIYDTSGDLRLFLQHHNFIRTKLDIEKELPIQTLCEIANFYINLPEDNELRVQHNVRSLNFSTTTPLKERTLQILEFVINKKKEKDIFQRIQKGKTYANAYYYLAKYYASIEKKYPHAMQNIQNAMEYNPSHFLAMQEKAKILILLNNYNDAISVLKMAHKVSKGAYIDKIGFYPEDHIFLDPSKQNISFLLGKSYYLTSIDFLKDKFNWQRLQEVFSSNNIDVLHMLSKLDKASSYLEDTLKSPANNKEIKTELMYYLGWIKYTQNNYKSSLFYWEQIPIESIYQYPEVHIAKANAIYYWALSSEDDSSKIKSKMQTSIGHLNLYREKILNKMDKILLDNESFLAQHKKSFYKLSIIENNLGAAYNIIGKNTSAQKSYLQSIEYSNSLKEENEIAQINLRLYDRRHLLGEKERNPLLMDFIEPILPNI